MNTITKILSCAFLGFLVFTSVTFGQDKALQQLIQGKKMFWEARFDQASSHLKEVIGIPGAKTEYLFEAYLYLGFVLMRQNAPGSEVNAAFEQAVKIDPKRRLDELVIPPDLTSRFDSVRNRLVGCLYIQSEPPDAKLVVLYEDSVIYNFTTPSVLCELLTKNYQILLTKDGYEQQFLPLQLTGGKMDTLSVTLHSTSTEQKKGGKRAWIWVARGGIVTTAAAVLYKTVLSGGGDNLENLPAPPSRPPR